jgi:hypothetical protein
MRVERIDVRRILRMFGITNQATYRSKDQFSNVQMSAPHLAFGGGWDASKLPEALASVQRWVEEKLK